MMRTEEELKAAAFDDYIKAAESLSVGDPVYCQMRPAAITLQAIFCAEQLKDRNLKFVDGQLADLTSKEDTIEPTND